jgi:Tol biopolymer transport system component
MGALVLAVGILLTAASGAALAAASWQIRTIDTPVQGMQPSFITATGDYLAWTGAGKGESRMFVYDLVAGKNVPIPISPSGSYYNPSSDGRWVAFQGGCTGGYSDIYLYDTKTGSLAKITSNADPGDSNDWNPQVDDGRVVWEKRMLGPEAAPGIYLYDIGAKTTSLVLAGADYRDPDLWEDYLVCVQSLPQSGSNASQIVLYNLATRITQVITTGVAANEHPRIDGGVVVWSAGDVWTAEDTDDWDSYQINLYDMSTGETKVLTKGGAGNTAPSIEGDLVAWQTKLPSTVMAYRISTGSTAQISRSGDTARAPEVDGTRIAWYGASGLYYAVPASEATKFPDVPAGHHYLTAIEKITDEGIMDGYGDGNFGPDDWAIRQQYAEMIVTALGLAVTETDLYDFADQPPVVHLEGELYPYHYVAVAALNGLMEPFSDGTFRPLYRIARDLAVAAAVIGAGENLEAPPLSFTGTLDHPVPLMEEYLRIAEFNGLLDNIVGPDGTLSTWAVQGPATRAELAQLLYNLLPKLP